ncbi:MULTISPECIES: hypothetical protein [Maribacter]|uniref:Membrane or secreted protein n=1 Tax=Maribacter flavus TaxID=1658664 RepID=A0ABU7IE45_9FLAO|nr:MULTISPECIES: hypothetical protein [Maribacter]MDC6403940.1 hypothetical protein [Maribacter sp. PR66]MEE1971081.1 hypothetical protein [Maribacter flavus]
MKHLKIIRILPFVVMALLISMANAQIAAGVYLSDHDNTQHELKINKGYLTYSVYKLDPAEFIKTVGGFYTADEKMLKVQLEFNSDFEKDGIRALEMPFSMDGDKIIIHMEDAITFEKKESLNQALEGQWLFATRGPDTGQERRGDENPRKTLKFLMDGRFQWIAYQTETMAFSGTGGGSFTSVDGVYTENIEFFSRDNDRVGARLEFNYEIKGDDWHHTGNNSRGEPMYEIWSRRN